jgi:flagellar L-ring protein precursor FlgH
MDDGTIVDVATLHCARGRRAGRGACRVCHRALITGAWLGALVLTGCASVAQDPMPQWNDFQSTADTMTMPQGEPGAIFVAGRDVRYFEDLKARRIGDVLTITLSERTDARKSASTATSRDSELSIPGPTIAGGPVIVDGREIFETNIETGRAFAGQGDSAQSNSLNGNITVTVVDVLPNGNLKVQGEKWININQGAEFIRLTGLVRPYDVQTDNTVLSSRVADAKIAYSGRGPVARANTEGWLSKLFNSPVFPL